MSLQFDERFFTEEIKDKDYPHYLKRAEWIANYINPNSIVYILGCGFGYLVKYLRNLGVNAIGIEIADYAFQNKKDDSILHSDVVDIDYSNAHYLFSWNLLDCLNDQKAVEVANHINKFSAQQIHIICTSEHYIEQGYFIKPMSYWEGLFPDAILIEYETRKVSNSGTLKIPLSWDLVSE